MTPAAPEWFTTWFHSDIGLGRTAAESYASMLAHLKVAPESVRLELAALLNPWRPIETATEEDKDGPVLGFVIGTKLPMVAVWDDEENRWFALNSAFTREWNPTHFRRLIELYLPAPPSEDKV